MNAITAQPSEEGGRQPEVPVASSWRPNEFDRRRIERALTSRTRYRYVSPSVRPVDGGYLIVSPCCSRNADPDGDIVDIALLLHRPGELPWHLYRKDHGNRQWCLHARNDRLAELLDDLNDDPQRLFWQ